MVVLKIKPPQGVGPAFSGRNSERGSSVKTIFVVSKCKGRRRKELYVKGKGILLLMGGIRGDNP
jgi:hypothetical protein